MFMKCFRISVVFFYFLSLMGCQSMVLEYDYVGGFSINEIEDDGMLYLEISGFSLHSSLNVKQIEVQNEDESLVVKIFLSIREAKEYSGGNFTYKFVVNESIEQVFFGENRVLIWERK